MILSIGLWQRWLSYAANLATSTKIYLQTKVWVSQEACWELSKWHWNARVMNLESWRLSNHRLTGQTVCGVDKISWKGVYLFIWPAATDWFVSQAIKNSTTPVVDFFAYFCNAIYGLSFVLANIHRGQVICLLLFIIGDLRFHQMS